MDDSLELEKLKQQLVEATETLRAIREGEVDAFVMQTSGGYRVASLAGADSPYRVLVESMKDGALTVSPSGEVLYCNRPFTDKVGVSGPAAVGEPAERWLELEGGLLSLLAAAERGEAAREASLKSEKGYLPTLLTACALPNDDGSKVYCLVVTDLSDRLAAQRLRIEQALLARQRAELQAILSCLPFAVVLAEPRDVVSYVNPIAEKLLERHPSLRTQASDTAIRVLDGASIDSEEVTLLASDGREDAFRVQATRLQVDGAPQRALVVFEDVTAHRHAERARERQQQLREAFVGILGHDLRTPLMAITAAAATLRMSPAPEQVARVSNAISRATARMTRLIDDMLDLTLSRIGGGIPLKRSATNLERIVRSAIEEITTTRTNANVEVRVVGDVSGVWDGARLAQVVSNLLSNAFEHGDANRPVRVDIDGTNTERVSLSVLNDGNPIAAELLPSIFDPFRRGDVSIQRRGGGIGLGLYIAERIVSAHGGTIGVVSDEQHGTRFTVDLPRSEHASSR
jgi:signal transduction histidine kinase